MERTAAGLPVVTIDSESANPQVLRDELISSAHDTAFIALGNRASDLTERFARVAPGARIVHCLSAGERANHAGNNVVSVPAEVPVAQYLDWLKVMLPGAKRVGILFDAVPNRQRASEFAGALQAAGYSTVLAPVEGADSLPAALAQLATSVDALQALPGPMVMAAETTRGLLLFSFRHRIPIIGPNVASVRAGALYALAWNYEEIGLHCAALALRPFATTRGSSLPPTQPRARVSANLRTAEKLDLRWSAELLRTIEQVGP